MQRPLVRILAVMLLTVGWLWLAGGCTAELPIDTGDDLDGSIDIEVADAGLADRAPTAGDLLAPLPGPALAFAVKGRVNAEEALAQPEKLLQSGGWFEARLAGGQVLRLDEDVQIYRYAADAAAGGRRSLVIEAARTEPDGTHARWQRQLARVMLNLDELAPLLRDGRVELDGSSASSLSLQQRTIVLRDDGVVLVKDCYSGLLDRQAQDGARLLLAAPGSTTLAGGDVLYAWGNVPLITDPAALVAIARPYGIEAHDGLPCGCFVDRVEVPCASWEQQALQTGAELDCAVPVPADLLAPAAERATLLFKGTIGADGQTPPPGLARVEAQVAGESYQLGAQSAASRYLFSGGVWDGKPVIEISSYGVMQPLGPLRVAFDVLLTRVPVALLEGLKQAGSYLRPPGPSLDLFAVLGRAEQVERDGQRHTRFCAVAISDVNHSALYACHDGNQSFDAPEQLQLAARIGLTTDPKQLAATLGAQACFCTRGGASVDCGSFPSDS